MKFDNKRIAGIGLGLAVAITLSGCITDSGAVRVQMPDGTIATRLPVQFADVSKTQQIKFVTRTDENFSISGQATQTLLCDNHGDKCNVLGGGINGSDGIGSAGGRLTGGIGSLFGGIAGLGNIGNNGGSGASVGPITVSGKFNVKGATAVANNKGIGSSTTVVRVKNDANATNIAVNGAMAGH